MNQDSTIIRCSSCGTKNRVPNGKQINKLLGAVSKEEIENHLRYVL